MISSFKTDRSDRPDTRFCLKVLNQDPTCTFASWHYTTVYMWLDVWLVFNNDIAKFHFSYLHWSHKDILNINNIFSRTAARARWAADQQMRAFNRILSGERARAPIKLKQRGFPYSASCFAQNMTCISFSSCKPVMRWQNVSQIRVIKYSIWRIRIWEQLSFCWIGVMD